jgi:hypothetical protein
MEVKHDDGSCRRLGDPIILLVVTISVLQVRWKVALLLFFFGPFAGTFVNLLAELLLNSVLGHPGEVRHPNFLWRVIGVYVFDFPYVIGLHSAVLATVLVILYARYGSSLASGPHTGVRGFASGVLVGGAVGTSFAALILLLSAVAHQNPGFADFVSGGTRDRLDLSTELLLSICTGAVDGILIATLGEKCFRPKHLDGAVESATT